MSNDGAGGAPAAPEKGFVEKFGPIVGLITGVLSLLGIVVSGTVFTTTYVDKIDKAYEAAAKADFEPISRSEVLEKMGRLDSAYEAAAKADFEPISRSEVLEMMAPIDTLIIHNLVQKPNAERLVKLPTFKQRLEHQGSLRAELPNVSVRVELLFEAEDAFWDCFIVSVGPNRNPNAAEYLERGQELVFSEAYFNSAVFYVHLTPALSGQPALDQSAIPRATATSRGDCDRAFDYTVAVVLSRDISAAKADAEET